MHLKQGIGTFRARVKYNVTLSDHVIEVSLDNEVTVDHEVTADHEVTTDHEVATLA